MLSFSSRLKMLREKHDLSQEQLAELIGTSQHQVSKYERGKNDPTSTVVDKVADVFNTTTDFVLGRTDNPDRPMRGESDLLDDEIELLEEYRSKPPEARKKVLEIVKVY